MLNFPTQPAIRADLSEWMHTAAECLSFCLFGMTVEAAHPRRGETTL